MPRVKLTEYRAKTLLQPDYVGLHFRLGDDLSSLSTDRRYVVKVDQGVKKRGKQGLIVLDVAFDQIQSAAEGLAEKGFDRFIAEPMIKHSDEFYLSFEQVRDGILLSYNPHGGIDVEEHPEQIEQHLITDTVPDSLPIPASSLSHIVEVMQQQHLSFVEINPLVIVDGRPTLLDAAVLVDDTAAMSGVNWTETDLVESGASSDQEKAIKELAESSTAAFSFALLNKDAPVWLLLSGGGASITIADEANNLGQANKIGNYGEYSGGPTTEETYLYTSEVLKALLASSAPKKALVIAGGVANFTDVRSTFKGVIQALKSFEAELRNDHVKIFVRRGGPNEKEGLAMMGDYLTASGLLGSLHGSDIILTTPVVEALEYVND